MSPFFKAIGAAMIALGLFWLGRGILTWPDTAIEPNRAFNRYVMSRQVEDLGGGGMAICLGILAFRYSRAR